jgi:hypothetical protein
MMDVADARTPWHVWVVGLSGLLLYGWGAGWGLWFLITGALSGAIEQIWLLGLWAAALGSIALLFRRREARLLFAAVLFAAGASAVAALMGASGGVWSPIMVANGLFLLFGGGFGVLYARAMARRGVLR